MRSVKFLLLLMLASLSLTSCYRKGCTDPQGLNYDSKANDGDPCWECDYNGYLTFTMSDATIDSLTSLSVTEFTIKTDGTTLGTYTLDNNFNPPTQCGVSSIMSTAVPAGRNCYLEETPVHYTVEDQNNNILWDAFTWITPKYCTLEKLSFQ